MSGADKQPPAARVSPGPAAPAAAAHGTDPHAGPAPAGLPARGAAWPGDGHATWWIRPANTRSFLIVFTVGALASVLALIVGARPLLVSLRERRAAIAAAESGDAARRAAADHAGAASGGRRSGAAVVVRVAPHGDTGRQRIVATDRPEHLVGRERFRVGVRPGTHSFLFALSIDDHGVIALLYPDRGSSLPVRGEAGMQDLPDSLELTGPGAERLIVLLSDWPLEEDWVRAAAAAAFKQAGGDVLKVSTLPLPAEQFHRVFIRDDS